MTTYDWLLASLSLALTAQSSYAAALMLYAWEDDEKLQKNRVPTSFEPPTRRFTIMLPARHEEAVIQDTIQRTVDLNYPRELIQVLVVIEAGDHGTIAQLDQKLAELKCLGIDHARLITFDEPPINKPHGLNVALRQTNGDIVTIFDAEDEPHIDILNVVNTVMVREGAEVVQCCVQLMNYNDRWYSALNVLEYLFWFKSRMHYHAMIGMMPLGGNTVFFTRAALERADGWDQACLTEDADIGIRLCANGGMRFRAIYDDRYVTREETPPTVGQFVKQRTRWNQGFLQILGKRDWLRLPSWRQRLLALYTLAFPLVQALTVIYVPVSLWLMFFGKLPVLIAMISALPVYVLIVQIVISLVGLYEFTAVHRLKPRWYSPLWLIAAYMPYQWILGMAALRAVWRQLRARIRSLLRRAERSASPRAQSITVGALRVDARMRRAWLGGKELQLTPKEFDLLSYLMQNRGLVLPRDQLLKDVWGGRVASASQTLDVHIRWLRQKVEPDPERPIYIQTVRMIGYRFEGP